MEKSYAPPLLNSGQNGPLTLMKQKELKIKDILPETVTREGVGG
jgi:hypothetical protein